jgi:SAM-dependent methyltransferase
MIREVFDITVPWVGNILARETVCLLCGERNIAPVNAFVLNGRRFHTVRCQTDGMMWLDPQPTPEFYERLYSEYYHRAGADDPLLEQATLDVHSDEARLRDVARLRLNEIGRFAGRNEAIGPETLTQPQASYPNASPLLLEVGFGAGYTLMEAQARGWNVLGLEVAQSCVDDMRARGVPAVCASLLDFGGAPGSFDVVAMYSVIEHTHDPAAYLRKARGLLKPRGLLVLRLPDTGDEGPPASLIAHLHHFNQATITELLRRCGFEVLWTGARALWQPKRYSGGLWSMNVISKKLQSGEKERSHE